MDWLQRLQEAGFQRAGSWSLGDFGPVCDINQHASASPVLYAFVCEKQVLYVGKTARTLRKRMYNYERPGPSQRTSLANHANLRHYLEDGRAVELWVFVDDLGLEFGGFRVSLAAGLEDALIATIRPPWNKMGASG